MRLRISGPQAIVVAIAARMASRDGRPPRLSRNVEEQRLAAALVHRLEHRLGPRIVRVLRRSRGTARGSAASTFDAGEVERSRRGVGEARMGEQVDQGAAAGERALDPLRPDDARPRPPSRCWANCRPRAPRRPRPAPGRRRGSSRRRPRCRASRGRSRSRSRAPAAARNSPPAAAARGRARSGRARSSPASVGSITVAPDLSFMFWRGMTAPTCLPSAAICAS